MNMLESLQGHWIWLALGLVLAALEMMVPGVNIIWFAVAALVTGGLTFALGISGAVQVLVFVALSLVAVFVSKRMLRDHPVHSADPMLNRRGEQLVGQRVEVVEAIRHGVGRVRIGDSEWIAHGPDVAAGEWVSVTAAQGTALLVEAEPD